MSSFFDAYPSFAANARAPIQQEFRRLARHMSWTKHKYRRKQAACYAAELAAHWDDESEGNHDSRLRCWQSLCEELGVEAGTSIKRCKTVRDSSNTSNTATDASQALRRIHVNIIDLMDSRRMGTTVRTFRTANQMMAYTRQTGKIAPLHVVKGDGFVSTLLKEIRG